MPDFARPGLSGQKRFVTNGDIADDYLIFAELLLLCSAHRAFA